MIVIDRDGRTLLFCDTDPGYPDRRWWVTPGGGVDPGETEAQAAVRELAEETGLIISESELIGPIARRRVQHGYSDQVLDQSEAFYAVRVDAFTVDVSSFTPEEKITLIDNKWWSVEELATTQEWIWPAQLVDLLRLAVEPPAAPLELGLVTDESTRPV